MDGNVPVPGWNAHRHPQDPLRPPNYVFRNVPKCEKDLKGSVLQEVKNRDDFKEVMAEMVLLCTEAMRRTSATRSASKPLSLEYIADRLDVDDPCFGYIVRSKEGMLQGFITVTTFTNWQKSFRWDSLHELAFYYDDSDSDEEGDVRQYPKKARAVDRDGRLARELQRTVRLGDPYNEGIVWPRIAEISLLGALGCGRTLVKLVIEQLEFQKRSGIANYDYIVLQATDNSKSFYESLGFVRVGAVTVQEDTNQGKSSGGSISTESTSSFASTESEGVDAIPVDASPSEKADVIAMPSDIVSSPYTIYEVRRAGETVAEIAKKLGVDSWDITFLNKNIYKDMTPKSRLMKGTILHVPCILDEVREEFDPTPTKWFVAKENDTPRKIAKKFGLSCSKLVAANQRRLSELQAASRLKAGTRIKVSNLDKLDDVCTPYCHWSYPDDTNVEQGEPSYMMAYRLERKVARAPRVVRNSLATSISAYSTSELLLPRPEKRAVDLMEHPDPPKPPPEPLLAVDIFKEQQRESHPEFREKTAQNEKILDDIWESLSTQKKLRYNEVALQTKKHYDAEYEEYEEAYSRWEEDVARCKESKVAAEKEVSLFSKVVTLREDALEGKEYKYWFVLTYIPDLKWCHLAPMVQDGVFGPERKRSCGRPRWRLVDESLCLELDISSIYCIPVKSKALKKTVDADKEEWDIIDKVEGKGDNADSASHDVLSSAEDSGPLPRRISKQPRRARSAMKPISGKIPVIKSVQPQAPGEDSSPENLPSPLRTRGETVISPETHGAPVWSPSSKKRRMSIQVVSPRRPPKRNASSDFDPSRKARKLHSSGARRSILQS